MSNSDTHKKSLVIIAVLVLIFAFTAAAAEKAEKENSRNSLYIVNVEKDMSDEQIAALTRTGAELVAVRGTGSYYIRTDNPAGLRAFSFIKDSEKAEARGKLTSQVRNVVANKSGSEMVELTLALTEKTTSSKIKYAVEALGGRMISNGKLFGSRAVVSVPAASVVALAEFDMVLSVEGPARAKVVNNVTAAKVSHIAQARNTYSLDGTGINGGIWDAAGIGSHPDLAGQFTWMEKGNKVSDHSTHVAGTIVGTGIKNANAAGMASGAHLYSYDFNGDVPTEMATAVKNNNIRFANNSWSYANGWSYTPVINLWVWWGDENFGRYSSESAAYDKLIEQTGLAVIFSAGNDRGEKGTDEPYLDMTIGRGNTVHHDGDGPYMSIDVTSSAKNVISVGAVDKRRKMTTFSSWGPTRDGRVKPEIVTDGQEVLSTLPNGEYAKYSGTSMAAPVASGGIAILMQLYKEMTGNYMDVAELRAILAATSTDLGRKGPDYRYGFGLFDAQKSAEIIEDSIENGLITRDSVSRKGAGSVKKFKVSVAGGTQKLRIALAWIDPAASANAEKTLVNDLNIRVYREGSSEVYLPWVLDPSKPDRAAVTGINSVDNIELVEINSPSGGNWIIEVEADKIGKGKSQEFALVVNASEPLSAHVSAAF